MSNEINRKPVVIVDTDIGPDCDDVGAVCLLHQLRKMQEAEMLAITCCASYHWGPRCAEVINRYYGCTVPVGQCPRPDFLSEELHQKYNKAVSEHFLGDERIDFEFALPVLRQNLASAEPGSVVLVTIGPLNNIGELLLSPADEFSHLSGVELVAQKVNKIVCMAGCFDPTKHGVQFAEWNVEMDIKAAQVVVNQSPVPVIFCGFEMGDTVITCANLNQYPEGHPLPLAYRLYIGEGGRSSWDLVTVLYAVRGESELMGQSAWGKLTIDDRGVSTWQPDTNGKHAYVVSKRTPEALAEALDSLLLG
ncbi:MAG: nucleoside hydrolase [Armatimonadota bacterium]